MALRIDIEKFIAAFKSRNEATCAAIAVELERTFSYKNYRNVPGEVAFLPNHEYYNLYFTTEMNR
jgi:hypothetical protein